jgi:hypothetical protein
VTPDPPYSALVRTGINDQSQRSRFRLGVAAAFLAILVAGCSLVATSPSGPTAYLSADAVAQAMQDDQFFANYGGDTLLVSGVVGSITTESGSTTVEFVTSIPTKVRCDLGAATTTAKVGDAITVRSDAGERQPSAVLLRNCQTN